MRVERLTAAITLLAIAVCNDNPSAAPTPVPAVAPASTPATRTNSNVMNEPKHPWRNDTALAGKFHPEYPDDLQVIVHEGGPRLTELQAELVWVRVNGKKGEAYTGTLLNQPHQLPSLKEGDTIQFIAANTGNEPFMVTDKYLTERKNWSITACNKCGMPDLFDAPSDLQAKIFPNVPADATMESFTSFCPVCGGVQLLTSKAVETEP